VCLWLILLRAISISQPVTRLAWQDSAISLLTILIIVFLAFIGFYCRTAPAAVPAGAPPSIFSSARAMKHLEIISNKPHPMGSPEHAAVRDYLVNTITAEGLSPEVQKATAVSPEWNGDFRAGTVENVIAS
jgi:hypothetical protein